MAPHTNVCRRCGRTFDSVRSDASTCGSTCRNAANKEERQRAAAARARRDERLSLLVLRRDAAQLVADTQRVLIAGGVAVAEGDLTAVSAYDAELVDIDRRTVELFGPDALAA